jgi:Fur family ferric uptake transcriptional regulator
MQIFAFAIVYFMKKTSTDQFILETLSDQKSHLTALQIFEAVHIKLPAINPSTVYRALERLVEYGKVTISDMGLGASVFELADKKPHHHMVCQGCGQIIMVEDEDISPTFLVLEKKYHFEIKTNHLILFGLCEQCQSRNNSQ